MTEKDHTTYETVRIYPSDAKRLKRLSFSHDRTIVRLLSEAVDLLVEEYKKDSDHIEEIIDKHPEGKKRKYKTTRVYPDDKKHLKKLSFFQDKPIVKLVSEAVVLVEQKYGKNYDSYDLYE
jgi:hypothetical protein